MRVFITGANGYIGGAVASALIKAGHEVRGLVRDRAKADAVAAHGIAPVIGSLDDRDLLQAEARAAEGVVSAASSDHRGAVEALIAGLAGSGKPLVHSSGSSIVGDEAMGEPSERIFHEDTPLAPEPDKAARVALDRFVLAAPGIRSVVLCNSMIYGNALGVPAESVQVPALVRQAKASGVARYIGRGLNRWSNVHIARRRVALRTGDFHGAGRQLHVCRERRGIAGRDCAGHRRPPRARPGAVLAGRCGDRRLGPPESGVLARLQQPGAGQGRDRAARLGTPPPVDHRVDRAGTSTMTPAHAGIHGCFPDPCR